MKALVDLHTHTVASGHAYSTWNENVKAAQKKGLKVLGISEHAPMMPGTCKEIYFSNFKVLPEYVGELRVLNGIEANIYDFHGNIDVSEELCLKLDYIIASLHTVCIESGSVAQNTAAVIGAMRNPYVKIIGHPDDDQFPLDYEEIVQAAKAEKVALELNDSSLNPLCARKGGEKNIRKLLEKCVDHKTKIIMGTDSHYCDEVGRFRDTYKLLEEIKFPEKLIINMDLQQLPYVLRKH
ncbi:MAG: phosphatase [Lachnospiraceae bacterium]|nr:phosphatase [Lachnospiraceae bacterium]